MWQITGDHIDFIDDVIIEEDIIVTGSLVDLPCPCSASGGQRVVTEASITVGCPAFARSFYKRLKHSWVIDFYCSRSQIFACR